MGERYTISYTANTGVALRAGTNYNSYKYSHTDVDVNTFSGTGDDSTVSGRNHTLNTTSITASGLNDDGLTTFSDEITVTRAGGSRNESYSRSRFFHGNYFGKGSSTLVRSTSDNTAGRTLSTSFSNSTTNTGGGVVSSSNSNTFARTTSTIGKSTGSQKESSSHTKNSNLFKSDLGTTYNLPQNHRTVSGFAEQRGGTSSPSGTTTYFHNQNYLEDFTTAGGAETARYTYATTYEYGPTNVSVTTGRTKYRQGGTSVTASTDFRTTYRNGATFLTGDGDGTGYENSATVSYDESTQSYTAVQVPDSQKAEGEVETGSFTQGHNLDTLGVSYNVDTVFTSNVFTKSTTTVSTEVSRIHFLPYSFRSTFTETMKIYTSTRASYGDTARFGDQLKQSKTTAHYFETDDKVSGRYNYISEQIDTVLFLGGGGAYGESATIASTQDFFTTYNISDAVTSIVKQATNIDALTTSFSIALGPASDYTQPVTNTELVGSYKTRTTFEGSILGTSSTSFEYTTIDYEGGSDTAYESHGFLEETDITYDTTTSSRAFLFSSDSTEATLYTTSLRPYTLNKDRSDVTFSATRRIAETYTTLTTYFDLTSITDVTRTFVRTDVRSSTSKLINVGSEDGSRTVYSVIGTITDHVLTTAFGAAADFATYSSSAFGLRFLSTDTSIISKRKNLRPPVVRYTENYLIETVRTHASTFLVDGDPPSTQTNTISDTVYTTSTQTAESWNMPRAQEFALQGFRYLFKDKTMRVDDDENCTISYGFAGNKDVMKSRATFTGTYESTVSGDQVTLTFSNDKSVFHSIVSKDDGAGSINDFITTADSNFDHTGARFFGGQQDYDSVGVIRYDSDAKFTLVKNNSAGTGTTEISGEMDSNKPYHSTTIDSHIRYSIAYNTEQKIYSTVGGVDATRRIATRGYARFTY